jgi:DNA-binding winged helix-turn-helix (wHTH) protein
VPPVSGAPPGVRYRFGPFVLSPGQRLLLRDGAEIRLIPRYFDLLVLLIERRLEAVSRQEIFDRVWADVVVSDGALSQAVRTLRRALGDDPREPVFIRTVSRHGYQFVHPGLTVESDGPADAIGVWGRDFNAVGAWRRDFSPGEIENQDSIEAPTAPPVTQAAEQTAGLAGAPGFEMLVARLLDRTASDEERRDAAEQLHLLGTAEALRRVDRLPGHARARAILRDARWDVPGAGDVPLLTGPGWAAAVAAIVWMRVRRAWHLASARWAAASAGGAAAGALAGTLGGLALLLLPDSIAPAGIIVALALVGAVAGGTGAAGIGAGLAAAEAVARSRRAAALVACGAVGGGAAGTIAHGLSRLILATMFGRDLPAMGGGIEGVALGAAAGLGYGLATAHLPGGGMAAPRGVDRLRAAAIAGLTCGLVGLLLAVANRHLVAASLDLLADRFLGSAVGLTPIARALGEGDLRPVTRAVVSAFEGLLFGSGLVLGLTRRVHD